MPRFVLLHHTEAPDYKPDHWDLMLEHEGRLLTWELQKRGRESFFEKDSRPLFSQPLLSHQVEAVQLPDHRLLYLDYEGPLSGNRGVVRRVDGGTFEFTSHAPDRYEFHLFGTRIRGTYLLLPNDKSWTLIPSLESSPETP